MKGTLKRELQLLMQLRPVGLVGPDAALIAGAVPPTEIDVAVEMAAEIVPAPGPFVGEALFAVMGRAAADIIAAIGRRVRGRGVAAKAIVVAADLITAGRRGPLRHLRLVG